MVSPGVAQDDWIIIDLGKAASKTSTLPDETICYNYKPNNQTRKQQTLWNLHLKTAMISSTKSSSMHDSSLSILPDNSRRASPADLFRLRVGPVSVPELCPAKPTQSYSLRRFRPHQSKKHFLWLPQELCRILSFRPPMHVEERQCVATTTRAKHHLKEASSQLTQLCLWLRKACSHGPWLIRYPPCSVDESTTEKLLCEAVPSRTKYGSIPHARQ